MGKETDKLLPLVEEIGKKKERGKENVENASSGPSGNRWTVLSIRLVAVVHTSMPCSYT